MADARRGRCRRVGRAARGLAVLGLAMAGGPAAAQTRTVAPIRVEVLGLGRWKGIVPWGRASGEYGLVLGAAFQRTVFRFREHPFSQRHTLKVGYSTGLKTGGLEYEYLSLRTDGHPRFHVVAKTSALDVIHYYGFGNETSDRGPQSLYDVKRTQLLFAPSCRLEREPVDVEVGPIIKYGETRGAFGTLLGRQQPYGAYRFGQLGARVRVAVDRRQLDGGRSAGGMLALEASLYPPVWSVTEGFGKVSAEGTTFLDLDLPRQPVVALRVGGERLFGRYPFDEAASLGGSDSIRGLLQQRYIGDGSAYGSAELRLLLASRDRSRVPRLGVLGFGDVGRVFLDGESSDLWHTAAGGGVFVSVLNPDNVLSATLARAEGRLRFYVRGGFAF